MAKKSNHSEMTISGKWLERFLNEDVHGWEFRELAEDAIKILNLDYTLTEAEPFITLIRICNWETSAPFTEEKPHGDSQFKEKISKAVDMWLAMGDFASNPNRMGGDPGFPDSRVASIRAAADDFRWLGVARIFVYVLLKAIYKSSVPWSKNPDICSLFSKDDLFFLQVYTKITTTIKMEPGNIRWVHVFVEDNSFKFLPVFSHIFFKFLFSGGQDYTGFCEHCGKFFVSQRKGRKKFCSDECRINQFHSRSAP